MVEKANCKPDTYIFCAINSGENTKPQQTNLAFKVPDTKLLGDQKPCAPETRDLIDNSSRFVHSAASRPKHSWLVA